MKTLHIGGPCDLQLISISPTTNSYEIIGYDGRLEGRYVANRFVYRGRELSVFGWSPFGGLPVACDAQAVSAVIDDARELVALLDAAHAGGQ